MFYLQEFNGNFDRDSTIGNTLDPPIIARFIKIKPQAWSSRISLRVELYGCHGGKENRIAPKTALNSVYNKSLPQGSNTVCIDNCLLNHEKIIV